MIKNDAWLNDLAKMAGGAAGSLLEMRKEVEAMVQGRIDQMVQRLQLVSREEFEVVQQMAQAARIENEALKARLTALEEMLAKK